MNTIFANIKSRKNGVEFQFAYSQYSYLISKNLNKSYSNSFSINRSQIKIENDSKSEEQSVDRKGRLLLE